MKRILLLSLTISIAFLTSCTNETLENNVWKMISMSNYPDSVFTSGDNFTILFSPKDSLVNGTATCNKYFGKYSQFGKKGISIDIIGATMAACPMLEYEHPFFNMLNNVNSYQIRGQRLFFYLDGKEQAVFETYIIGTVHHITDSSIKYLGEYSGILPAADCPGIETKLSINDNSSYTLDMDYIDRDSHVTEKGTYTIDGDIIALKNQEGITTYYKIEDDNLIMLDNDKKPIAEGTDMASHFILKKVAK